VRETSARESGTMQISPKATARHQALAKGAPAIQSGRLSFEFHNWITANRLQIGIPKHYLDIDITRLLA
jgi:hypothetical protein